MSAEERTVYRGPIVLREFQPEDRPAVVKVLNAVEPDRPTTVEEHRDEDAEYEGTKYLHRRYVALDSAADAIVGEGEYFHLPWSYEPTRFGVWLAVHPEQQRRGIGRALYDRIVDELRALRATQLRTWTQESRSAAVAFLLHRGFRELMRHWESRLDLTTFDFSRFGRYWSVPPEIEITTLAAELAKDPSALEETYEMDCELSLDVPRYDPFTPPEIKMYRHHVLERPGAIPAAHFLAKDGDRYIGVSNLERFEALPNVLNTGFTGVRREYRGRGIAFALKLRAIDYAKRSGIREIRTGNSTLNAAMLGINVKLGFVRQPAWISFGKDLSEVP